MFHIVSQHAAGLPAFFRDMLDGFIMAEGRMGGSP